jgi:hypothetical protein
MELASPTTDIALTKIVDKKDDDIGPLRGKSQARNAEA